MYPKKIEIPAAGESHSYPDLEGIGFQVVRLDFLGSEDPQDNPTIEADAGRISVLMSVGDPIEQSFSGLTVHNDNTQAAGTFAILRVYEPGDTVSRVPRKRQMTARSPADIKTHPIGEVFQIGSDSSGSVITIPSGRDRAYRVISISTRIYDVSLTSGYSDVHAVVDLDSKNSFSLTESIGVGGDLRMTLSDGFLVPKDRAVQVRCYTSSDGSGTIGVAFQGIAIEDKNGPIPPL